MSVSLLPHLKGLTHRQQTWANELGEFSELFKLFELLELLELLKVDPKVCQPTARIIAETVEQKINRRIRTTTLKPKQALTQYLSNKIGQLF